MRDTAVAVHTPGPLLAAVAGLEPVIRASAADLEEAVIPDALVRAFEAAGVFDAWHPAELTGRDLDPIDWLKMIEAVSRIDGSAGWLAFIVATNARMAGWNADEIVRFREMTGGRLHPAISGMPRGRAIPVEGGYRVTGRWAFASSAPFATWHAGGALIFGENGPELTPEGHVQMVVATWPATQSTMHKTWDGLGLRGTGSDDIEVVDLFVPADQVRTEILPVNSDTASVHIRQLAVLAHGAHALGVAQAALDEFARIVSSKPAGASQIPGAPGTAPMGHFQAHRIAYAKADAAVRAARVLLHSAVAEALAAVAEAGHALVEHNAALRQANIFAVRSSRDAVDQLFQISGTGAVYRGGIIERAFRDMATAANHFQVVETQYESVGSYLLTKDAVDGPVIVGQTFI